jgi:hypothetical protein
MKNFEKSFDAFSNNKNQFRDFFIELDATISLTWDLDFTLFNQTFCCGASPECSLPKIGAVVKPENFVLSEKLDFLQNFQKVSTLDNLVLIKAKFPELYQWYKENSHNFYISSLNNGFIRTNILKEFSFKGINEVKISSSYLRNEVIAEQLLKTLDDLHQHCPIQQLSLVINPLSNDLINWAQNNNISVDLITEKELLKAEDNHDVDLWPNIFYMSGDKFYLTKHDSQHSFNSFASLDDSLESFIQKMINKRISYYRLCEHQDPKINEYLNWVTKSIIVNNNFTFIPSIMIKDKMINNLKWLNFNNLGILKPNSQPIPLISIKE